MVNPNTDSDGALLNEVGAATLLGITPRTLRLWRHTRGVPHLRLTPRVIRFRKSDLDGWLAKHRVAITR